MARDIVDYVALALVRNKDDSSMYFGDSSDFSGDLNQLRERAETLCGFEISDQVLSRVIRSLADCNLIRVTEDDFSGTFLKVKCSQIGNFFQSASADFAKVEQDYGDVSNIISHPSDYPSAAALMRHELFDDYQELGSEWLSRALEGLRRRIGEKGSLDNLIDAGHQTAVSAAPAADRIVTLDHNQQHKLDGATSELINLVEDENSVDGDTLLRQRLVGELRAGRELIRGQSIRAYLLYNTLVSALGTLIEKYGGAAIGIAAAKLLELLIQQVFGK